MLKSSVFPSVLIFSYTHKHSYHPSPERCCYCRRSLVSSKMTAPVEDSFLLELAS